MPSSQDLFSGTSTKQAADELEVYASEFATLVSRYPPSRQSTPTQWLQRLPSDVFYYYREGISTFGATAQTPDERRGRLYLIHTGLLFMWMKWGKKKARHRFQTQADKSTRRAATLVTLEHYRRGGVIARYEVSDWYSDPVSKWTVSLISGAVDPNKVPDPQLEETIRMNTTAPCTVEMLSTLRKENAVPSLSALPLD